MAGHHGGVGQQPNVTGPVLAPKPVEPATQGVDGPREHSVEVGLEGRQPSLGVGDVEVIATVLFPPQEGSGEDVAERSSEFRWMSSFRMQATIATSPGFPRLFSCLK